MHGMMHWLSWPHDTLRCVLTKSNHTVLIRVPLKSRSFVIVKIKFASIIIFTLAFIISKILCV